MRNSRAARRFATRLRAADAKAGVRTIAAQEHVEDFCAREGISFPDPSARDRVSASFRVSDADPVSTIVRETRYADYAVMARASTYNGLPRDFLGQVLTAAGKPVLIAGRQPPQTLTGTILVCWRETAEAARALLAAQPLLRQAQQVVVCHVREGEGQGAEGAEEIAARLSRNGVPAVTNVIERQGAKVQDLLAKAAQDCGADLVVMGAYGHSRMREAIFGGATQAAIEESDRPVLLMH